MEKTQTLDFLWLQSLPTHPKSMTLDQALHFSELYFPIQENNAYKVFYF